MKSNKFNFLILMGMLFLIVMFPLALKLVVKNQDKRGKATENNGAKISFKFAFRGVTPESYCLKNLGKVNIQVVNIPTGKNQLVNLLNYMPVKGEVNKFGDQVFEVRNLFFSNMSTMGTSNYLRIKGLDTTAIKYCIDNQDTNVMVDGLCNLDFNSNKVYDFSDYPLILGDINRDGLINQVDLKYIQDAFSKSRTIICGQRGDLNIDGKINSLDLGLAKLSLNKGDEVALLVETTDGLVLSPTINSLNISTTLSTVTATQNNMESSYNLENFDNVSNFDSIMFNHDLSAYGAVKPVISKVNNDVESNDGMLVSFTEAKENGYAQLFAFSKNIPTAFKNSTDKHYVRTWFAADDNTNYDLTLILSSDKTQNYIDGDSVILTDFKNKKITSFSGNSAGYGPKSSVRVPKGFKGWVSFPLKNLKISTGKDKLISLKEVSHISLDVRPVPARKSSYYIVDNLLLTTKTFGATSKTKYELSYKYDQVGIYYATWFDFWREKTPQIYNITEIQKVNGQFGPMTTFHYWGEPQLGYYLSSDKEVIKTHMRQLVNTGVDFLFIDNTNLAPYYTVEDWNLLVSKPLTKLLDTMLEMRNNGEKTPYIINWVGSFGDFNAMMMGKLDCREISCSWYAVDKIYNEFYTKEKYADLWVYWNDKPFIATTTKISNPNVPITTRTIWALQQFTTSGEWTYRQEKNNLIYGKDNSGKLEQMSVSAALALGYCMSDPTYSIGRKNGLTFYNQWLSVYNKHPKVTFVGTWNEWGAQRVEYPQATCKDKCFTDEYNLEYSSDIEPMKGGYGDLYYQWLKKYIEDYKNYKSCPRLVKE